MGFGSTMWLPLLPSLAAAHHVRMLDAVGGANKSTATNVISNAGHVVAWMDELLDTLAIARCPIVGASIGGWMAANFAMARPERVTRLAMLAPAGIVGSLRTKWVFGMALGTAIRPAPAKAEWLLDNLVMEATRPRLRADPWRPIAQQFIVGMANIHRNLGELRPGLKCSVDRLAASDIPVLILMPRDETGHDGPMMVRRYRQQLPQAQVALVNDANHLVFIDRTNLVGHELQKFLES
jgi:pimeloyl-ACP methyl ester carboxylesterase